MPSKKCGGSRRHFKGTKTLFSKEQCLNSLIAKRVYIKFLIFFKLFLFYLKIYSSPAHELFPKLLLARLIGLTVVYMVKCVDCHVVSVAKIHF